ncbi:uncharacterized protein V2V93DRAFT_284150 [Kockiozyma suomiensis]|uniref:uncharacterized protein n=1 Tax=Kockiozyma suomiensis TaxID=1337062 RepID=UPI0033431A73
MESFKSTSIVESLSRLYNVLFPTYPTASASATPLNLGILGAAAIAPTAVINPAKRIPDKFRVYSVAARDPARAKEYAKKHGIIRTHESYEELINDPDIHAVYIPLPNGLHYEWAMKCIDAGKPVLVEKPVASNADQAAKLFDYARSKNALVTEAFHWYFYPAAAKIKEFINDTENFGEIIGFDGSLTMRLKGIESDIRASYSLAGGSLMDMGCYPISWMRYFFDEEPISAKPLRFIPFEKDSKIEFFTEIEYAFASNPKKKAVIKCGLQTPWKEWCKIGLLPFAVIRGTKKQLTYTMPMFGNYFHNIAVKDLSTGKTQNFQMYPPGREVWGTYEFQLESFHTAITQGKVEKMYPTEDSVNNMRAVDMAYAALDLPRRE